LSNKIRLLSDLKWRKMADTDVSIRLYRVGDEVALLEAARESVREVRPFMPWCHPQIQRDELRGWIEAQVAAAQVGTAYEFAIIGTGGSYLGGCGLNQIDAENRRANLGYWVRTSATRRGVATMAVRQLAHWAFRHTSLIRLEIVASTQNIASVRTALRAGAEREGVLKNRLWLHGVSHDAVVLSIVRPG